jgi:hypothetical protein
MVSEYSLIYTDTILVVALCSLVPFTIKYHALTKPLFLPLHIRWNPPPSPTSSGLSKIPIQNVFNSMNHYEATTNLWCGKLFTNCGIIISYDMSLTILTSTVDNTISLDGSIWSNNSWYLFCAKIIFLRQNVWYWTLLYHLQACCT